MPQNSIFSIPAHQLGCLLGFRQTEPHRLQLLHALLHLVLLQVKQHSIAEPGSLGVEGLLPLSRVKMVAPADTSATGLKLSEYLRCS